MGVDSQISINSVFVSNNGVQYLNNKSLLYTAQEYTGPSFETLDEEINNNIYYLIEKYGID